MTKLKLTQQLIAALEADTKDMLYWDNVISGLFLKVTPKGKKSFYLYYRNSNNQQRKPKIGDYPSITIDNARTKAQQWKSDIVNGKDPSIEKQSHKEAMLISQVCERYMIEHALPYKKPSSIRDDKAMIKNYINPTLGKKRVDFITREDIAKFHHSLKDRPYQANHVRALLSKLFNLCELWGLREQGTNPTIHVKKFKEYKRERYLSSDELQRLSDTLHECHIHQLEMQSAIDCIRLLIFTGCRLGEIQTLRWQDVNIEQQRLELSDSKTGAKFVYLTAPALSILNDIERVPNNPYVIIGRKEGTHLQDIQKIWQRIRKRAYLEDVRIHDLRHSFASVGAGLGLSLPMIGKLLGHTQATTTARYAHLANDPTKQAAERIANEINNAMQGKKNKKHKKIHNKRKLA